MGSRFTAGAYLSTLQHFSNTCDVASSPPGIMSGLAQRWTYYFIVSKMLELGDTLFLGALGKPIGFLHWWHHIAMFTFCYFNGVFWHPHLISGVFWNYSIHAVMYSYYAAQCVGIRWPYPQLITALQIIQMFAQITAVVASIVVCKGNYVSQLIITSSITLLHPSPPAGWALCCPGDVYSLHRTLLKLLP